MHIPSGQIANLCTLYGKDLELRAAPLDPKQVLWAFAGVESSFGQNFAPRHEPSYCRSGKYYNSAATREHGCLAHCSYGPWQVMFANFPVGITPRDLLDPIAGPELSLRAAIRRLNRALVQGASELSQLADAYNSGSFRDDLVPGQYVAGVLEKYKIAMPQAAMAGANQ